MPSTRSRHPTARPPTESEYGRTFAAGLGKLFSIRISNKRRSLETELDHEILRLFQLRRLLEKADTEVVIAAIDYLGSPEKAALWLSRPEAELGNAVPLYVAASEDGKEAVIELLMGLDRPDNPDFHHGSVR